VEFDNAFIFKYVRRFRCPNVFFAQDLLPSADRARRMLAYELLVATGAVRNLIRENQLHHLENTIQMGRKEGMVLMDNCLYDLYCKCAITYDTAMSRARHPERIAPQKV
jgi:twitching motility protein PilT